MRILAWLLLLVLFAVPLRGQAIVGQLLDASTGATIRDGHLDLLSDDRAVLSRAVSDSTGHFRLEFPDEGRFRIRAAHPGHRTAVSMPLQVARGDTIEVEFRLSDRTVLLAPLVVKAPRRVVRTALAGYYERLESPVRRGRFLTREQIEKRHASFASDLLRTIAGVRVVPREVGGSSMVLVRGCEPRLFLDGLRVHLPDVGIDELVTPADLEGIEVYGSAAEVPIELGGSNSICGAIVLWTKRGRSD
jgi:hypothetical protein